MRDSCEAGDSDREEEPSDHPLPPAHAFAARFGIGSGALPPQLGVREPPRYPRLGGNLNRSFE